MDTTRWSLITPLFEGALALPLAEQEAYVRARADDDALADEVLALLGADAREQTLLDGQPLDALPEATADDLLGAPEAGRIVGPYRIVREVGRGGMGAV